jgi:hypothetical protein
MEKSASMIDTADTPQWVERMTLLVEDALRELRSARIRSGSLGPEWPAKGRWNGHGRSRPLYPERGTGRAVS